MNLAERRKHVDEFNDQIPNPRFMVSTEAGGEGLNMQVSCHTVFNYDLPWNPIRLQQRIGRVYRYGQKKQVQVYSVRLESDSEAFADGRIDDYLLSKIREITETLAEVQHGNQEDLENEVLGQIVESISIDELYQNAVKNGEEAARAVIDKQGGHIQEILLNPDGMLGLFKGLKGFSIIDYQKAAARVTDAQLEFFVRQYMGRQHEPVQQSADGLLSFKVPAKLREVAGKIIPEDKYTAKDTLPEKKLDRVTVSKEVAQRVPGSRLLRFGDLVFDCMVRHVQDSDFGDGIATLAIPTTALGWTSDSRGVCAIFDLKVVRQEGTLVGIRVLREELAVYLVPREGQLTEVDSLLERIDTFRTGPLDVDEALVSRAYSSARKAAEDRLSAMHKDIVGEFGTSVGIVPQLDDFALAWVGAVS